MLKNMNLHTVQSATCWDPRGRIQGQGTTARFLYGTPWEKLLRTLMQTTLDLGCEQAPYVLQQASNKRMFNTQNYWILFDRHGNPNKTDALDIALRTFKKHYSASETLHVLPDSRVYLLIETGNDFWEVWDGFRSGVSEEIKVSRVGAVTSNQAKIEDSDRTNFRRVTLKASTVILEPSSFVGWDEPIRVYNLDVFAKMHYAICSVLTEQLNFTMNLTFSPDYGWSYGNGTYSGLIGQLQREEIDFTAAGGLMRGDRMDVGDLTVGTFMARTVAIFKQPPLSAAKNIFTLPFGIGVWTVMLAMMFLFTMALILVTWSANQKNGKPTALSTALDAVTMVLGAICQQGPWMTTHSVPARLVTFTLFLTAVFLFTSYAATIVVLLQSTSRTIVRNLNDLADKPITFSVQDTKHNYIYFNETVDKNIKKIYLNKIKPQGKNAFTSPEVGVERVRNEFHSFLGEISLAYNIISKTWQEHEKCSLSEIELFKIPLLTLYVTKKSGYRDVFKQKMIQQHEVGLKHRIFKTMVPQKQKCDSALINFHSVSMKEAYPVLLFLGYSIFISLLIFLFEHIFKIETA
ncbi:Ionotropic glutamate receptor [Cinara cedri]|uniref:Ionotropic glutamate receptor n=1 Tax=Cinara cedri TaxID=506608 RepID=A0A5E4MI20_9HEMI|nr:Ionotropic glutamate receptor [Cinara cedri]